jgi:hypothetical protein
MRGAVPMIIAAIGLDAGTDCGYFMPFNEAANWPAALPSSA